MTASNNVQAPDIGLRQNWVDMEVFDEGAIEFIVEVGQRVEAGQPIARISN